MQMNASTHRGRIRQSYGGVGRNLADGMARLGRKPLFLTTLGDDQLAADLIRRNPLMVRIRSISSCIDRPMLYSLEAPNGRGQK